MSETVTAAGTPRKRRPRTASPPKPVFVIVQVLGEDGNPVPFNKNQLKIVGVERDAEVVMEKMESAEKTNAFYLRIAIPATPPSQPRAKPSLQAAA